MATTKERAARAIDVAAAIWAQLTTTTEPCVLMSWGIRSFGAGEVIGRDGVKMPCLVLDVSGLVHDGLAVVAYNEGADTYEVALFFANGTQRGEWVTNVYFDGLGTTLDELIERPKNMSDDDYKRLSEMDSFLKELLND